MPLPLTAARGLPVAGYASPGGGGTTPRGDGPPRAGPHATIRPQPSRNPALAQEEHASDAGSPAAGPIPAGTAIRDQILVPHMPEPHFGLAHSMGGAIALNAAYETWLPFRRLVTTTPMIALCIIKRTRSSAFLARVLRFLGMGSMFVPGGGETSISTLPFKGNRLTGDPVRYARNAEVAHAMGVGAIGAPTVAWMDSAFRFMKRFADPRYSVKIRLPTLIVAAGADPVCATPATERFASRLKAGRVIVIPGARHEILMERDVIREQFWAAFDAFIPGSPDPVPQGKGQVNGPLAKRDLAEAGLSAEKLDGGGVDPAVSRSHDAPAVSS